MSVAFKFSRRHIHAELNSWAGEYSFRFTIQAWRHHFTMLVVFA